MCSPELKIAAWRYKKKERTVKTFCTERKKSQFNPSCLAVPPVEGTEQSVCTIQRSASVHPLLQVWKLLMPH